MNLVLLFAILTFAVGGAATQKSPRKPSACEMMMNSPLATFFQELEGRRSLTGELNERRKELIRFLHHSQYMRIIAASIQDAFARHLVDPALKAQSAQQILDNLLREDLKAWARSPLRKPVVGSVADLEKLYDSGRVVRIEVGHDVLAEIMSGNRRELLLPHHLWDVKSGAGELVGPNGQLIPIEIESVVHHVRSEDVDSVLSEQSAGQIPPGAHPPEFTAVKFKRKLH